MYFNVSQITFVSEVSTVSTHKIGECCISFMGPLKSSPNNGTKTLIEVKKIQLHKILKTKLHPSLNGTAERLMQVLIM